MSTKKPILFSGIQPSGSLTIGNYIGAIRNWRKLQDEYQCLFTLVDLHTITVKQDPKMLREHCYDLIAFYISCGIDPKKNLIFMQSHVPSHAQLTWILNCFSYMGELNRMTQFKDKSKKHNKNINVGLFDYPVLMAADILLYNTNLVPVGDDQKQHLELTRDIAIRFNNIHGNIFTIPEPYIPLLGARIMSLQNPTNKMSKSDTHENAAVGLLDSPDVIRKKLKRAVTDSETEIYYDVKQKPGISNLLALLSSITDKPIKSLEKEYIGKGYGDLKKDVGEALVTLLTPIQTEYKKLKEDIAYLQKILRSGAEIASSISEKTLKKVYDVIGLVPQ